MTVPSPQRISSNNARKGRRLHNEGRVNYLPFARVYTVNGDHDTYLVIVNREQYTCTCPHHGVCSHIAAVKTARRPGATTATVLPSTPNGTS